LLRTVLDVTGSELRAKEIYQKTLLKEQEGRFMTMNRNLGKIHAIIIGASDTQFVPAGCSE